MWCPKENKALCCKADNSQAAFELDVYFPELKHFSPDEVVLTIVPVFAREEFFKEDDSPAFSKLTNATTYRSAFVPLDEILEEKGWYVYWAIHLFALGESCPKLTSDNRCSIYNQRPYMCRAYPLVSGDRRVLVNPLIVCKECANITQLPTIKQVRKYEKRLKERLRPLLREHKKAMLFLMRELLSSGRIADAFKRSTKKNLEDLQKGVGVSKGAIRINLPLTFGLIVGVWGIEGVEKQIEATKKLIAFYKEKGNTLAKGFEDYLKFLEDAKTTLKEVSDEKDRTGTHSG